jgi:RIO kinase 1
MNNRNTVETDFFIDEDELEELPTIKNLKAKIMVKKPGEPYSRKKGPVGNPGLGIGNAAEGDFQYSYQASRHERQWIKDSLREFYEQKWFDDILRSIKGGKEASVYLCRTTTNPEDPFLAAKVYRPRRFRNLKKDHLYREGRSQLDGDGKIVLDDRSLHAMQKRTAYGKELLHTSWIGHEFKTMELLHEAGVDIPKPLASGNNAILMSYVGDELAGAPSLNGVSLAFTEAKPLYQRVIHNIELMLANNRIHADLSAYNILYWQGAITLIDFPQAIHPDENHNAFRIFARDVMRVCEYFASQGVKSDPLTLTQKMWKASGRRISPSLDPHYLDPENEEDRRVWAKQ